MYHISRVLDMKQYDWVTSQQTALSALPPSSPSLHSLLLFPVQYLARQLVSDGCRHTLPPAGGSSAGRWMCSGRAGWGSAGASGDLWGTPGEVWEQGAISSGRNGSSGSRVSGPGRRGRRWCGGGTDGGRAWGGSGMETALGTWEEEEEEGVNVWLVTSQTFSAILIFTKDKYKWETVNSNIEKLWISNIFLRTPSVPYNILWIQDHL